MKLTDVTILVVASVLAPAFAGANGAIRSQEMVMDRTASAKSDSGAKFSGGASGILLGTRESPAIANRTLTEGYLSQPLVMGMAMFPRYGLDFTGTLDLEGLTLKRGELNAGISGEGYIDRRHPHTYLHELVATWERPIGPRGDVSASAGKGFVPFGSDDPMMRPFVKYPVNHHLAQILERAIAVGAFSYGPLGLELSRFNGDEPESPSDLPNSNRLFDSWAGRATARIRTVAELQGSFASVKSPEVAVGGGLDQRKWSASGRYESGMLYGLAEFAHTEELEAGRDAFSFRTMLAEGSLTNRSTVIAARVEQTDRAEEERLADLFRTPRPATDLSILGITRWTVLTVNASHSFSVRQSRLEPFLEIGRAHVGSLDRLSVFDPASFYGSDVIWSLSAGLRFGIGMAHHRMGRYGAALPTGPSSMTGMDMSQ